MSLSQILVVLTALTCITAFASLGDGFQNAIVGTSVTTLGSAAAAAGDNPLPTIGGDSHAGTDDGSYGADILNGGGSIQSPAPTLGEAAPVDATGAGAEGRAFPGQQVAELGGENPSSTENLLDGAQGKLDGLFNLNNFMGPLIGAVGGVAAAIAGTILPVKVGAGIAASGFFGVLGKGLLMAGAGALLVAAKAVLIVGGAVLAIGAVGWGIYKIGKHFYPDIQEMLSSTTTGPEVGANQQGAIEEPETTLPTEEDLADALDSDGDGVSLEDEIAAEGENDQPSVDVPDLDDGSEEPAAPDAPTANTDAEKFAKSLIDGSEKDSRDKFENLLGGADTKSNAQVEAQAAQILDFLQASGYEGNAKVQQWTEEAIMMGYDPRLPLALVKLSRSGDYSNQILNDFGGAWNAISDDAELYDIIDQLGTCGGGSSCASATTNLAHNYVSGGGHRLSANPDASANKMTAEIIEAIEMYLSSDASALHTAEVIRPLLETYPR